MSKKKVKLTYNPEDIIKGYICKVEGENGSPNDKVQYYVPMLAKDSESAQKAVESIGFKVYSCEDYESLKIQVGLIEKLAKENGFDLTKNKNNLSVNKKQLP